MLVNLKKPVIAIADDKPFHFVRDRHVPPQAGLAMTIKKTLSSGRNENEVEWMIKKIK